MLKKALVSLMLLPVLAPSYLLRFMGLRMLGLAGATLGAFLLAVGFRKKIVTSNLQLALGKEKSAEELALLTKKIYRNTGTVFLEILRNFSLSKSRMQQELLFAPGDRQKIDTIMARGKGAIFLSAHMANWELSAMGMAAHDYNVAIVVKKMNSPLSQALIERVRERCGMHIIYSGNTIEKMKVALQEGKAIGFMMDQNTTGKKAIRANFFNTPASTIRALAKLVKDTGTPILPYCICRLPDGRHQVQILDEVPYVNATEYPEGSPERWFREEWLNTQAYQNALETLVRKNLEHWLWIHRRWKADRTPLEPSTAHRENMSA